MLKKNIVRGGWLLLGMIALFACKTKKTGIDKKLLTGTWQFSEKLNYEQLKQMPDIGGDLAGIQDAEMTISGKTQYLEKGDYISSGNLVFRLLPAGSDKDINLNINFRETGVWELRDSLLLETTKAGTVTAADSATKAMAQEDPEMLSEMRPKNGERTTDKIISISAAQIELYSEKDKLKLILRKE